MKLFARADYFMVLAVLACLVASAPREIGPPPSRDAVRFVVPSIIERVHSRIQTSIQDRIERATPRWRVLPLLERSHRR
jgi:hypothetical protein